MADLAPLDRRGPMAGRRNVAVTPLPPLARFSLRGPVADLAPLGSAFGIAPGQDTCRATQQGDRAILWLGPDEWMLVASLPNATALFDGIEQALAAVPHSLVDISHRNTGFTVMGDGVEAFLAEGCPLDLDQAATPVGFCSRTVLGKSEVVLWRVAPDAFRIECWRSFAPYVAAFLAQATENL
ncbi:sarcosine oxidase subunit gamma family protein [Lichenihabitans sp. Uapishka_5]|uniref:sarcosine oxidase subunit gamma n=1 Tax=Lichenihabitans sp. Uapishka_5 TaxID=3037302 RepID=UPI0029E7E370|nr:sarcosine oxidase subunit gamma family protein [Lichenihabitans sp. Uapishka_5]MDX7951069.1 sarcosine oxidase subunit gamma family protein [Lichenihabitans sp. Uapishka_5]